MHTRPNPLDPIDRMALLIKVKPAFIEYIQTHYPNYKFSSNPDPRIQEIPLFLVPMMQDREFRPWLQLHFKSFIYDLLEHVMGTSVKVAGHPTLEDFERWFDYEFYPMVYDTLYTEVNKDVYFDRL